MDYMQIPYRKPGKFSQAKQDPLLTKEKLAELQDKLDRLKKSRPFAASEVMRLAELGDFSENVEYQLAKGRLRGINSGILKLEYQINHAVIIDPSKNLGKISLGHKVTVEVDGKIKSFQILGSSETNPGKNIISHNSPIGSALLGHKVGDVVEVKLKDKVVEYIVINIE
jgi:transcription elongation factor GreA